MNLPGNSIDISEEDGVRSLHFGSEWVQGAMRVRRPYALELAYTREMAAGLILRAAPPRRVDAREKRCTIRVGFDGHAGPREHQAQALPQVGVVVDDKNGQGLVVRRHARGRSKWKIAPGACGSTQSRP